MSVTPTRSLTLLTVAAMFGFGVANCTSKVPALPSVSSESVGPLGGTVATSNGTGIYIPPGALTSNLTVTVENVASAPLLTQGTPVGQAILCGPEGAMFADPVTITLAFKTSELPFGKTIDDIVIYTAPVGSPDYTSLVTTLASDNQHVIAQTTHFSYFVPIIPFPESAHPDAGVDATVDDDTGTGDNDSGQPPDTSAPKDTGTVDSTVQDTGSTTTDSGMDTGTPDTGPDTSDAGLDTGSASDTGSAPPDTGPADTGSPDTGSVSAQDSGSATDTGSAVSDTGSGGSEAGAGGADASDDTDQ